MDYDGEFALWEVKAALSQAIDWVNEQMVAEYIGEEEEEEEGDE